MTGSEDVATKVGWLLYVDDFGYAGLVTRAGIGIRANWIRVATGTVSILVSFSVRRLNFICAACQKPYGRYAHAYVN